MKVTEGTFTATTRTVAPPGAVAAAVAGFLLFAFIAGSDPTPPPSPVATGERVPTTAAEHPPSQPAGGVNVAASIVVGVACGVAAVAAVAATAAGVVWSRRKPPYQPTTREIRRPPLELPAAGRPRALTGGRRHPSLGNIPDASADRERRR